MSVDLYSSIRIATAVIALGILALGLFRAVQMGRGFVNRLYRARALWTAAVILLVMFVLSITTIIGNAIELVGVISLFSLVLVLLVFADRTIQVAVEMDFFHRNTLHWGQIRKPLYVILLADVVYSLFAVAGVVVLSLPLVFWPLLGTLSVAIIALAVSAGRTSDRTIRRHVRLFGVFLVCFLVALFYSQPGIPLWENVASDLIIVAAAYSLYLMVMSLSPVGRVEKAVEAASHTN